MYDHDGATDNRAHYRTESIRINAALGFLLQFPSPCPVGDLTGNPDAIDHDTELVADFLTLELVSADALFVRRDTSAALDTNA